MDIKREYFFFNLATLAILKLFVLKYSSKHLVRFWIIPGNDWSCSRESWHSGIYFIYVFAYLFESVTNMVDYYYTLISYPLMEEKESKKGKHSLLFLLCPQKPSPSFIYYRLPCCHTSMQGFGSTDWFRLFVIGKAILLSSLKLNRSLIISIQLHLENN